MDIKVDIGAALRKTQALLALPKATNYVVNQWAADTVTMLKRRAAGMQKAGTGRKTGHLQRNIGLTKLNGEGHRILTIGTGVGNTKEVKYASVQDKGGTIRAKNKKYLTIPLPGVKGRAADYRPGAFFIKSKTGNLLLVERKGKGIRPLFLLRTSVNIPASNWFTGIVEPRHRDLDAILTAEHLFRTAQGMTSGGVK